MSVLLMDLQRLHRALKFDSLIGENIYSTHKETETSIDRPHQSLLLKGQWEEIQGTVCHHQIQDEGVGCTWEEEEEDVRVRVYSAFWWIWFLYWNNVEHETFWFLNILLMGFTFHSIVVCQEKSLMPKPNIRCSCLVLLYWIRSVAFYSDV